MTTLTLPPTTAGDVPTEDGPEEGGHRLLMFAGRATLRIAKSLLWALLTLAVVVGLWWGLLAALHLNPYFAKTPGDVYDYLFTGPTAAANRQLILSNLGITLRDAALGYVGGTIAAVAVAALIVLRSSVEQTVMPVAVALRAVPLVAMTPLLVLIFGRGLLTVTIIAGIVTFFPSLVNLVFGLRSAPANAFDLMRAYGASELQVLRKIQFPYSLAALFASAKIAAPGAIVGATLAEWLATGKGLGNLMLVSSSDSQWGTLWSCVVVITIASVLIYNLVTIVETPVVAHFRGTD